MPGASEAASARPAPPDAELTDAVLRAADLTGVNLDGVALADTRLNRAPDQRGPGAAWLCSVVMSDRRLGLPLRSWWISRPTPAALQ